MTPQIDYIKHIIFSGRTNISKKKNRSDRIFLKFLNDYSKGEVNAIIETTWNHIVNATSNMGMRIVQ